jgi:hypothetical protein
MLGTKQLEIEETAMMHSTKFNFINCLPFSFMAELSESDSARPIPTFSATESSRTLDRVSRRPSVSDIGNRASQKQVLKYVLLRQYLKMADKRACFNWKLSTSLALNMTSSKQTWSSRRHPSIPQSTN